MKMVAANLMRPTIVVVSFILVTITTFLFKSTISQEVGEFIHGNCSSSDGKFEEGSKYQTNLYYLLSNLTSESSSKKFYNFSTGETSSKVYGLYYCYYGLDNQLCQSCIQKAENRILQNCSRSVEAIVWHDMCMLRYANRSIFSTNDVSKYYLRTIGPANYSQYNQEVSNRFINLFDEAISGCSSFVSATRVGILEGNIHLNLQVECTPDLSKSDCRSCLKTALARFDTQGHRLGVLMQPSCGLSRVFDERRSEQRAVPNKKLHIGLWVTSGIAAVALSCNIILLFCLRNRKVTKKPTGIQEIKSMENLHIELDVIKAATSNFSEANKLGEGGFGSVYKGTLGDGQAIAVKRLSNASRQGIREFKTEACLAAKLQHNNLVKVYGFCCERDELLLVYEFAPNKSLDRLLYDSKCRASLKWETRYKIILGIARGLLYLHEDSNPKIIHRDIKPSNIVLDGEMNPKIADFGMAKLFGGDQSQENTSKIAGTFGYMAPEYAVAGNISIKSDIFSYGVILLEIVSGLRNWCIDPNEKEDSLLSYAWKLWNEGSHLNFVDTTLGNNFSTIEIERCIHVGLLSTQEDPSKRPNMSSVLIMLNTQVNNELPLPTSPPIVTYRHETTPASNHIVRMVEDNITELSPR